MHRHLCKKTIVLTAFMLSLMYACVHKSLIPGLPAELTDTFHSKHGDDESKNMIGRLACISCHKPGGSGEGVFTLAGSVYKSDLTTPNINGTVRFYTGPQGTGTLLKTIEVDKVGNFYANVPDMDFNKGVYPMVESTTGNKKYMVAAAASGDCLSCHGISQDKIHVD